MIHFGSGNASPRSESRQRLEAASSSTIQPSRRNVSMTDNAALSIANLQISNPKAYQATMQELALLTSKGDKFLVSEHGDNATQVKAERAHQGLQNINKIEKWYQHSGVGNKVESAGFQAKAMADKMRSLLEEIDPSGSKTGELRAELEQYSDNLESKLNPSSETKRKARKPLKDISLEDHQSLLSKTIGDAFKQIDQTRLALKEKEDSIESASQPKPKTQAQKAAAKRKRENYKGKQKLRKEEKQTAVITLQRLFRKNPAKFRQALIASYKK